VKADYITELPPGYHSTYGVGATTSNRVSHTTLDGVKVPIGEPVENPDMTEALIKDVEEEFEQKRRQAVSQYESKIKSIDKRRINKDEKEKLRADVLAAHEEKLHALMEMEEAEKQKVYEKKKKGSLLYNEYMVYTEEQVMLRYLLNIRFHYKSGRR